jgi:NAD-dependent deacetylase
MRDNLQDAIDLLVDSKYSIAYTGAGISVESGIPPFRGENGLWSKYDPNILELSYFYLYPDKSWKVIKEIFYDFFGEAKPNKAHTVLAELEHLGLIKAIVTQNIDNLHFDAGSKEVYEFHGNSRMLVCIQCKKKYVAAETNLNEIPLCNSCHDLLKPDFIFFGERIPEVAYKKSVEAAQKADVVVIIGSTGEVYPAASIPRYAKENGAKIIEINPENSLFTDSITDIFVKGRATEIMNELLIGIKQKI